MARPRRWKTPLGAWLAGYGVARLLSSLRSSNLEVSSSAVYHWAAGRRAPRYEIAVELERLSDGRVTIASSRKG